MCIDVCSTLTLTVTGTLRWLSPPAVGLRDLGAAPPVPAQGSGLRV